MLLRTVERGERDECLLCGESVLAVDKHVGGERDEQHRHRRQRPQDPACVRGVVHNTRIQGFVSLHYYTITVLQ